MPLSYRLEDYGRYLAKVGSAAYVDITRRTDPARSARAWEHLQEVLSVYGYPWVVQVWTKDIEGTLFLGEGLLRDLVAGGVTVTAQVTVTGLAASVWEPLVPVDTQRHIPRLAQVIGGVEHICWRYDPIIPGVHDPARFRALARQMRDLGVQRGVINFIAPPGRYARVDRRLAALLPGWEQDMLGYDDAWREGAASELVALAQEVGIALSCCAEGAWLAQRVPGLGRAACGDAAWFARLSGVLPAGAVSRGSRKGCGCLHYFDVGDYGNWSRCHRCAYCYAG